MGGREGSLNLLAQNIKRTTSQMPLNISLPATAVSQTDLYAEAMYGIFDYRNICASLSETEIW